MNMTRMLRFGMASAALFAVFSVSAAEGPVLKVPALARLEIAAAELKPAPAGAGHAADLKVTVRNSGAGVAAPFGIVVSYQGRALQHLKWPGLGAGAQDTRTARLALPPAGGPICVQVGLANVIGAATKQACMTLAGVAVQRSVVPGIPAFPPQTSGKPVIGKKPGTGPAGRTGVLKAQVALLAVLTVNVDAGPVTGPVTVGPGGRAVVIWGDGWDRALSASGVHLLVHTSPLESVNCAAPPATASPDSGKYTTPPRALTLTNAYYRDRQTYYLKGCLFNRTVDPVTGQVTDTYTGDWTNMVKLRVDSRPDLVVVEARVFVEEPLYKVGPGWRERDWNAITSFPPLFSGLVAYSANILNKGGSQVDTWRTTLILNGKKYLNTAGSNPPLAPGASQTQIWPILTSAVWKEYQQNPRLILGTVYVDEENRVVESDEWNFRQTRLVVSRVSPTNLQVVRDMRVEPARTLLRWVPSDGARDRYVRGYLIGVRYTLVPPRPAHGGIIIEPVQRIFTVDGHLTSFFTLPELPWGQMRDHRACFRVVAYLGAEEFVSAPSNEVCLTVPN